MRVAVSCIVNHMNHVSILNCVQYIFYVFVVESISLDILTHPFTSACYLCVFYYVAFIPWCSSIDFMAVGLTTSRAATKYVPCICSVN